MHDEGKPDRSFRAAVPEPCHICRHFGYSTRARSTASGKYDAVGKAVGTVAVTIQRQP